MTRVLNLFQGPRGVAGAVGQQGAMGRAVSFPYYKIYTLNQQWCKTTIYYALPLQGLQGSIGQIGEEGDKGLSVNKS